MSTDFTVATKRRFLRYLISIFSSSYLRQPTQGLFLIHITSSVEFIFKICTITYQALSTKQPAYLHSMLTPARQPRQLRSTGSGLLSVPRVKTNAGTRAFSVAAPTLWNSLPDSVKSARNIASFRRNLKTYLFKMAYPP